MSTLCGTISVPATSRVLVLVKVPQWVLTLLATRPVVLTVPTQVTIVLVALLATKLLLMLACRQVQCTLWELPVRQNGLALALGLEQLVF